MKSALSSLARNAANWSLKIKIRNNKSLSSKRKKYARKYSTSLVKMSTNNKRKIIRNIKRKEMKLVWLPMVSLIKNMKSNKSLL